MTDRDRQPFSEVAKWSLVSARLRFIFPWGIESGIRSSALTLFCALGLIVTWIEDHGYTTFNNRMLLWLAFGIVVLMMGMYAQVTLVIRARRSIGERRSRLIGDALANMDPGLRSIASTSRVVDHKSAEAVKFNQVVIGDGLSMYHLPGCRMAIGRSMNSVLKSAAENSGFDPCGICAIAEAPARVSERNPINS